MWPNSTFWLVDLFVTMMTSQNLKMTAKTFQNTQSFSHVTKYCIWIGWSLCYHDDIENSRWLPKQNLIHVTKWCVWIGWSLCYHDDITKILNGCQTFQNTQNLSHVTKCCIWSLCYCDDITKIQKGCQNIPKQSKSNQTDPCLWI